MKFRHQTPRDPSKMNWNGFNKSMLVSMAVMYCVFAFISGIYNPTEWLVGYRFLYVFFYAMLGFIFAVIHG